LARLATLSLSLAVTSCSSKEVPGGDGQVLVWVAVVATASSPNNIEFERLTIDVRDRVGEDAFGIDVVVSPIQCFDGLVDEAQVSETDYVIAVRSPSQDRARSLADQLGIQGPLFHTADRCHE